MTHSNPVRQSVFTVADVGSRKAECAAARLLEIAPKAKISGFSLTVPMPGHPLPEDEIREATARLDALTKEHDFVWALTDSREARWLPSVLAKLHDKRVITVALGFDTCLIQRHGRRSQPKEADDGLSCFFCHDVVVPGDTMAGRSLDQACTVVRPGISQIASGMAVELFASWCQAFSRPEKDLSQSKDDDDVPHNTGTQKHNFQIFNG